MIKNMSAVLGPIHYWLYHKIEIQNKLVEEVIRYANEQYMELNLSHDLEMQFGNISNDPLEEQIDTTNIHGWLQEQVSVVEFRLAYAITTLLSKYPKEEEKLKELFFKAGDKLTTVDKDFSISEIFKYLNDILLDGMPCDHANALVSQDETEVIWKRNLCVHEKYWGVVGGDINNYYLLREEFIKGLIKPAHGKFMKLDDITNKIIKIQ